MICRDVTPVASLTNRNESLTNRNESLTNRKESLTNRKETPQGDVSTKTE